MPQKNNNEGMEDIQKFLSYVAEDLHEGLQELDEDDVMARQLVLAGSILINAIRGALLTLIENEDDADG